MRKSHLELRALPLVALAYVVGPLVAVSLFWLGMMVMAGLSDAGWRPVLGSALGMWLVFVVYGGAVCLVAEVLFITPLLFGFRRYRWRWLNGRTGAVIGFLLGAVPWFVVEMWPMPADYTDRLGYHYYGGNTLAGWGHAILGAMAIGSIGAVSAIVFRLIAVRTVEPVPGSEFAVKGT